MTPNHMLTLRGAGNSSSRLLEMGFDTMIGFDTIMDVGFNTI